MSAQPTTADTDEAQPVIIRRWPKSEGGGLIALFPAQPAFWVGWSVDSYEHVGGHGPADYLSVVARTKPANISQRADYDEVRELIDELRAIGYNLSLYHRRTDAMRDTFNARQAEQIEAIQREAARS